MWWIFFTIFVLISIFSSVTLFYALRRITQHEEIQLRYENLLNQIQQIITFSTEKMKQIDAGGHFESDDEVGFFFDELKNIQNMLDNLFDNEEIENAEKKK
jgi:hypothetical protein